MYRHTTLIFKVLLWKQVNACGKEQWVDKGGKRVSSHAKAVSFVFKPRNYILQSSSKLLQILRVTLNSLENTCHLILYQIKMKGALFYWERKETEK